MVSSFCCAWFDFKLIHGGDDDDKATEEEEDEGTTTPRGASPTRHDESHISGSGGNTEELDPRRHSPR